MKLFRFLLALPLAALLAGCSPVDSLHPLYTEQDVVFDETLLGQWGAETDGLNFARLGANEYRVVMSGKDEDTGQTTSAVFDAHLVELNGARFLDVVWKEHPFANDDEVIAQIHFTHTKNDLQTNPRLVRAGWGAYLELLPGKSDESGDVFGVRLRPAHQFFKLVIEDGGRALKLVQLDDSWIESQIREGNLVIDHETVGEDSLVLTASTPELQKLVLDHVNDNEAFRGDTIVRRTGKN
jgi:hypothetical protein